ncbi:hypothetical protein [Aquimarina sp. 2304DJ70-9]|uniref:hypothetical protein n=1 Tax=Aquimarina penaris TaxID=3231044 RepID=UPI003462871F
MGDKGIDKQWTFNFLINEFKKETDRAAVILVAALIDEALTTILKSYLIPIPNATDNLFEGGNAPISTFSSKIDVSYRLGIISSRFCRDIHLIRKIRNSFAHDIYGCNFENGSVKSRVSELSKTCEIMPVYDHFLEKKNENIVKGTRGVFLFISSVMIYHLNNVIDDLSPLKPMNLIEDELLYTDGKKMIKEELEKEKAKTKDKNKE